MTVFRSFTRDNRILVVLMIGVSRSNDCIGVVKAITYMHFFLLLQIFTLHIYNTNFKTC